MQVDACAAAAGVTAMAAPATLRRPASNVIVPTVLKEFDKRRPDRVPNAQPTEALLACVPLHADEDSPGTAVRYREYLPFVQHPDTGVIPCQRLASARRVFTEF